MKKLKLGCTETVDRGGLDAVLTGVGNASGPACCSVSVSKLSLEGERSIATVSREEMIE